MPVCKHKLLQDNIQCGGTASDGYVRLENAFEAIAEHMPSTNETRAYSSVKTLMGLETNKTAQPLNKHSFYRREKCQETK